ncbi:MAG: BioY family transporter [Desulfobacteraceae bacterium 4572_19]|nr:MAG: BioY family transporter [Desulfobacteraceae bacterium 4572_19]
MNKKSELKMTVYAALFAALTATGAYISIPVGPVPIVLQNFFVLLSGLLLGSRWGATSIAVYLLAGACGLPVFAGGTSGIAHFAGPTGGYLVGFLGTAYVIGFISERTKNSITWDIVAMICGMVVTYAVGLIWLKQITGMTFSKTLAVGLYPFLFGAVLKIIVAIPVAKALRIYFNKK